MHLKFLAISDTHLGEGTSFLSFPRGLQHLWRTLLDNFGGGQKFQIDELILVGDIADTSLASISQVITGTNAFIRTLRSAADIDKIVYIPGNHDHTVWTEYMEGRYPRGNHPISEPGGELLVDKSVPINDSGCDDLLTIFFGYIDGPTWRKIKAEKAQGIEFDFSIANPIYAKKFNNRTYIFTHGTHFKSIVATPRWIKRLVDYTQLDWLVARLDIESNCELSEAESLENLEEIISPFVNSIYISSKHVPTSRSDHLWYLCSVLRSEFEEHRPSPDRSTRNTFVSPPAAIPDRIIKLDSAGHKSIELLEEHFLDHLLSHLDTKGLLTNDLTFVYGDIHDGGWGEITSTYNGQERNIHIFNCGSWVVHHRDDHPPCHVFAVEANGTEYLLDVSFRNVRMVNRELINLAALDYENHRSAVGFILRKIMNLLRPG